VVSGRVNFEIVFARGDEFFENSAIELNIVQFLSLHRRSTMKLDPFDLVLLAALQADGRVPQSELGQRAHLSTAAVNRRLKLLQAAGVIERFSACLNPKALGYDLTVITEVKADNERADLLDDMQRRFAACPQVQQCYYVAGAWDFVLIFLVRSMDQYVALTRELFFAGGNVKTFSTQVAMNRVKTGSGVPVEAG
jgi:DNA-binding Lrp family transcriptional regulator